MQCRVCTPPSTNVAGISPACLGHKWRCSSSCCLENNASLARQLVQGFLGAPQQGVVGIGRVGRVAGPGAGPCAHSSAARNLLASRWALSRTISISTPARPPGPAPPPPTRPSATATPRPAGVAGQPGAAGSVVAAPRRRPARRRGYLRRAARGPARGRPATGPGGGIGRGGHQARYAAAGAAGATARRAFR